MQKSTGLEKGIRELFRYAFLTNCHLDQIEISNEEIEAINTIDCADLLEGFKDLIVALLKYKKDSKSYPKENFSNQYEKELKRIENDLNTHLKIEQQLKVTVEFFKQKFQDMEKKYNSAIFRLKEFEKEGKNEQENEIFSKFHRKNASLNNNLKEFRDFQIQKFSETKQFELRHNSDKIKAKESDGIEFIKKKLEEKSKEIAKIQEKIRVKINSRSNLSTSPIFARKEVEISGESEKNIEKKESFLNKNYKNHARSTSVQAFPKKSN